ncbi:MULTISPECIES: enolase C-terminal domain-like protein [unclassified Microbacterium]|uniref:enolase C-terminal domain-like protein n=1 Tax=unclassified Microbacterium TaxID=2609290 RepID=UPI0021A7C894|nr:MULTISPECIES: enolase C-terminal domain-like protein [unclassified Microbacterium]MCT1364978.1 dipeptide epimerase [Microbacterium sp. p3-SID131]MCT1375838.1 dipeptide epimerase [Microbacterium sp. p3-SID337]
MTVVERIRVLRVPSPLARPFVTAVRRTAHLDVVLVEVTDADGRRGYGEAATSWRVTGESPESVAAVVAGPLADAALRRSVDDPGLPDALAAAAWGNAAARSAVACALADLTAQHRDEPLAQTLATDGDAPARIRTDMTLSVAEPAALAATAVEHAAAGFRCLKIKASQDHDTVAGLQAVRAAVGPDIALRVDANQAWDAGTAIRVIRAAEDAGVGLELVEQPVAARDLDALAVVTAAVDTPIMADESVRTAQDVRDIAARGAAELVNVKLAKTGGLSEALACVQAARSAGLGVVVGCMMESHVGVAAAAHLAAAVAPDVVHDLDAASWLRRSPVTGGLTADAEWLTLAPAAGLGITGIAPDAEVLLDRSRTGVLV